MALRWHRIGAPSQFGPSPEHMDIAVGWAWQISRQGAESRQVRVEVLLGVGLRPTDLPAVARNAIRSRGASAVDEFLAVEEPPERLIVSRLGVRAA